MAGWMMNCKEYAELTSQAMDQPLSFWDRVSMKLHQVICPPCKHIQVQFSTIRKACQFSSVDSTDSAEDSSCRLSDEACERIKTAIIEAAQNKER